MKCRHCKTELELEFLDLGNAPPSNAYLNKEDLRKPEVTYPLRVLTCTNCWLVQTDQGQASNTSGRNPVEMARERVNETGRGSHYCVKHSGDFMGKRNGVLGQHAART